MMTCPRPGSRRLTDDLLDLAVLLGLEDVFHLHRFDDRQLLAGLHFLTDLDRHFAQQARHRRQQELGEVGRQLLGHQRQQFGGAGAHHHEVGTGAPVEQAVRVL
jgi:hypothetical protein